MKLQYTYDSGSQIVPTLESNDTAESKWENDDWTKTWETGEMNF